MKRLTSWLIRWAYAFRLRRPLNDVQRWIAERNAPRSPLPRFDTPRQLVKYLRAKFEWRADKLGRFLPIGDWSSSPEVFQAQIEAPGGTDGDCDDISIYAGTLLRQMSGVSRVLQLCVGYQGGAHVVPVYECRGAWYTLNGRIGIRILKGVYGERSAGIAAVALTIRQMRPDDPEQEPRWWVLETLDNRMVARGPV